LLEKVRWALKDRGDFRQAGKSREAFNMEIT
jgi:hypothetical protein